MTVELIQGSEEWKAARAGSLGASSLHEVVARTKSGWSASRENCLARLVVERLTGVPQDTFMTAAMQHGVDTEAEARAAYQFETTTLVKTVGLVRHPTIAGTHASPDGYVGEQGMIEIKCPQLAAHLDILDSGTIPGKYIIQMQWQMRCCKRAWVDFISYQPSFPENMRLFIRRVPRDDKRIAELEQQVLEFLLEVAARLDALTKRYGEARAAA